MHCHRCQGLVVLSLFEDHMQMFVGGRCMNCGDIIDRTILRNRLDPLPRGWALEDEARHGTYRRTVGHTSRYDRRMQGKGGDHVGKIWGAL